MKSKTRKRTGLFGRGDYRTLVVKGKRVGSLCISSTYNEGRTAYISGFGIKEKYRGRGYGHEMMRRAVAAIAKVGEYDRITLRVGSNNEPAKKIYRAAGFRKFGGRHILDMELWVGKKSHKQEVVKGIRSIAKKIDELAGKVNSGQLDWKKGYSIMYGVMLPAFKDILAERRSKSRSAY